ncbi:14 kDa subunit of cytochrome bd ubiquinol oxidase [Tuber magnatum]|uniref:Cytochrome b-c1 complex subunit 7 n=1 Tax=Tuber magnatum TaxID=42249 RepID=A0A317SZU1_9PEZI|nr:14 kDa subunit of cytochrome bd ubiquinol oxidase [Tuber magnatum]
MGFTSGLALCRAIVARPWLHKIMAPIAETYNDLAGYRKLGLVRDDLIAEENEVVQEALKRLPPKVAYDRVYRLRRAVQCSLAHTILPKEEHTKPERDISYLMPYIEEIERERKERAELDSLTRAR